MESSTPTTPGAIQITWRSREDKEEAERQSRDTCKADGTQRIGAVNKSAKGMLRYVPAVFHGGDLRGLPKQLSLWIRCRGCMSHPEQAEACRTEGSEAADPLLHPDACLGDEMRRAGCFGSHKKFLSPFFRSDLGDKGPPFKGVPFRWSCPGTEVLHNPRIVIIPTNTAGI